MKKIFGIKNCDNCRKARKHYSGKDFLFIDVRTSEFSKSDLSILISIFGGKLVNKNSKTWRSLSPSFKLMETKDIITKFPTVMKRPAIVNGSNSFLGWPKNVENGKLSDH